MGCTVFRYILHSYALLYDLLEMAQVSQDLTAAVFEAPIAYPMSAPPPSCGTPTDALVSGSSLPFCAQHSLQQAFMVWNFGDLVGCVLLLVLIKFLIVAMVMKSFGFSWEASTLAGACMAQVRVNIVRTEQNS